MKPFKLLEIVTSLALLLSMSPVMIVHAEDNSPWSVDSSVALFNKYIFRGFNLFDGSALQPSLGVNYDTGYGTITASGWAHLSLDPHSTSERFTEIDQTTKYSLTVDDFSFVLGNIWYSFPDDKTNLPETCEAYLGVAWNGPFTASFTAYHDYRAFDAQYYEAAFSDTFDSLIENMSFSPFVVFGFGTNAEKVYTDNGLEQITVGVSTTVPMGSMNFIPVVNYTAGIDDSTSNTLWFGATLSRSF